MSDLKRPVESKPTNNGFCQKQAVDELLHQSKQPASNGLHQGSTDLSAEQECLGGGNVINQRLMLHESWNEDPCLMVMSSISMDDEANKITARSDERPR